jgi:hypothetical protein
LWGRQPRSAGLVGASGARRALAGHEAFDRATRKISEADFLRNIWEGGDEEDRSSVLEMLKDECEVREGRFDNPPEFPV